MVGNPTLNAMATSCMIVIFFIFYFLVNSGLMANVKKAFTGEVEFFYFSCYLPLDSDN